MASLLSFFNSLGDHEERWKKESMCCCASVLGIVGFITMLMYLRYKNTPTKALNTRMFMFKHKHTMAVKTITITEEAYEALRRIKERDRSFSEVIIEITRGNKNHLDKFFGVLKGSKVLNDLRKNIKKYRMQADSDARKRAEKLRQRAYDSS